MTEHILNRTAITAEFLYSGETFVSLVRSLPEPMLDCSTAPGEWTARQIVHHVADDADLWCFALKKAIACPGVPIRFEGFPGNERWFAALGFGKRPVDAALDLISAHRRMMVEIASDPQVDWAQSFIEIFDDKAVSMGKWSVAQILEMLTGHTTEHLRTIQSIKEQS